jgi:hypothetical protein
VSGREAVLNEALAALTHAAERLRATRSGVAGHFPLNASHLESLSELERERLDAYAIRYARCQDLLFPAMRALGRAQLEPKAEGRFLDLFALMQKQGLVGDIDDWEQQRGLRNAVAHEYPHPEQVVDILNGIHDMVPTLLDYVQRLRAQADRLSRP